MMEESGRTNQTAAEAEEIEEEEDRRCSLHSQSKHTNQ